MTLTLCKSSVSLAGWPFALHRAWFLHVERLNLREAGVQIYKFNVRPYVNVAEIRSNCSVILWSAKRLFTSTTKTEERYIARATNSL